MTLTALATALSVLTEHGLSAPQARALLALRDGKQTMSKLAEALGHTTAAATGNVEHLFKRDWVERSTDAADRRLIYVSLTTSGLLLLSVIGKKLSSVN